jgi:hypothetical protein
MQISPGTQLVWSLSGSEAVNLGMPKIEPDHLYCALLKFVELSDDTIARLLNNSSEAPSVCRERNELADKFKNLPGSTTEIRHALRKQAEHGTHKLEGNLIHRSDASRKIFEKAIEMANDENEPVYPTHLLRVLMDSPTPAMKKVLKLEDDVPKWLLGLDQKAEEIEEVKHYPAWIQPVQDLAPRRGFSVPSTSQPQRKVLDAALTSSRPSPLLLICESGVDPLALLGKVVEDNQTSPALLKVDLSYLLKEMADLDNPEMTGKQIAFHLEDLQQQDEQAWMFLDLTKGAQFEDSFLDDLIPLLSKGLRLIAAVSEKSYHARIKTNEAAEAAFRAIWLHDLSAVRKLSRI